MALDVVTYQHPDEDGWKRHMVPHIAWLQDRLKDGSLLASGPVTDVPVRSALLIVKAADRPSLELLISSDPFAQHGLIENMTVSEWDPIFGLFNDRSSMAGLLQGG